MVNPGGTGTQFHHFCEQRTSVVLDERGREKRRVLVSTLRAFVFSPSSFSSIDRSVAREAEEEEEKEEEEKRRRIFWPHFFSIFFCC